MTDNTGGAAPYSNSDGVSVVYYDSDSGVGSVFSMDPSVEVSDGECSFESFNGNFEFFVFGCWACPTPTNPPSLVSSFSPSHCKGVKP